MNIPIERDQSYTVREIGTQDNGKGYTPTHKMKVSVGRDRIAFDGQVQE